MNRCIKRNIDSFKDKWIELYTANQIDREIEGQIESKMKIIYEQK